MKIRLDKVRHEPLSWQETCEIASHETGRPELVSLGPVSCSGRVSYASPGFLLKAEVGYVQPLLCDRCLKSFEQPVAAEIELLLLIGEEEEEGERALGEGDLGVINLPDELFDSEPLIAEQVQLNVPMKPLCREGCAGLCPRCGADRNAGLCACGEEPGDPRWAALAELKDRWIEKK